MTGRATVRPGATRPNRELTSPLARQRSPRSPRRVKGWSRARWPPQPRHWARLGGARSVQVPKVQGAGWVKGTRSKNTALGASASLAVTLSQSLALSDPSTVTRVRFFAAVSCP
jgi:hypothetical protein